MPLSAGVMLGPYEIQSPPGAGGMLPAAKALCTGESATKNEAQRSKSVQAKAHPENDPTTPQTWLPNRTEPFSISHHSMIAILRWARFSTLRRLVGSNRANLKSHRRGCPKARVVDYTPRTASQFSLPVRRSWAGSPSYRFAGTTFPAYS